MKDKSKSLLCIVLCGGGRLPKWFLAAELLLLLVIAYPCFLGKTEMYFSAADMLLQEQGEVAVSRMPGGVHFSGNNEEMTTSKLVTKTFSLHPGSYQVQVNYRSRVNSDPRASFENGTGTLTMTSGVMGAYVYFDFPALLLRDSLQEVEQTVQIVSPLKVADMQLQINWQGNGELSVYSIRLEEVTAYKVLKLLGVAGLLALLNGLAYSLLTAEEKRRAEIAGLTLLCAFGVLPFLTDFCYFGHDLQFHLNRIVSLADELRRGSFFSPIYTTSLYGYGYANPLFYGQLFLYLPAALYACGFSLCFSYNTYIIAITLATIFIMYYVSKALFQGTKPALFATALYTFNPVRLSNVLVRAAVGEYSAQAFMPLILLGFYRIYTKEKNEPITWRDYISIVIGLTCILLTHTLSLLMSGMIIAAVCLLQWKRTFEKQRFLALFKAAALTLLLNVSTFVPFLTSYGMPMVVNGRENFIQGHGAYLPQLLSIMTYAGTNESAECEAGAEMSFTLGFAIVIGLIAYIALLIFLKKVPEKKKDCSLLCFTKWCFAITVVCILMSSIYLPYNAMYRLPEPLYALLTIHQFPWRWRVFAVLFGTICAVYAIENIGKQTNFKGAAAPVSLLVTVFLILNMGQMYDRIKEPWQERPANNSYKYTGQIGWEEYLIFGTDKGELVYSELRYDEERLAVSEYQKDGNTVTAYVKNHSAEETVLGVPLMCYDNYLACYDTGEQKATWPGVNNCVTASVPGGYEGTIRIVYHFRSIWKVAIGTSVVVLISMIGYGLFGQRKKKKA